MTSGGVESDIDAVLDAVSALPDEWQPAGSFRPSVLRRLVARARGIPIRHSAETGVGKSTLLLSHLSDRHVAFTIEPSGRDDAFERVRGSPLLRSEAVTFVLGPSQRTLAEHVFDAPLDFVLIDGPHAYPFPELEYFRFYPHVAPGGLLVVDDVHIPTVNHLFRFLLADEMWRHLETARTTAFFERTDRPVFNPHGDGWERQGYNRRRHPAAAGLADIPAAFAKRLLRRLSGR